MINDPIADMFTRIRNAYKVSKKTVKMPYSIFKEKIAQVLVKHYYLKSAKKDKNDLELILDYRQGQPAIKEIETISKSGLRIYKGKNELPYVLSGLGIAIISTSQGLMTAQEARKKGLGGEIICKVF